jgi:hypothetical protein
MCRSRRLSSPSVLHLVRGVFASCYQPLLPPGFSRRYLCESFLGCLSPYPGGPLSALAWFFPSVIGLPHEVIGSAFPLFSANTIFHGRISRLQLFRYVPASEFACLPDRSHRCRSPVRAAEAFTSEQNVRRYLHTYRICYPPDYRQLVERGLPPRKIRGLVGCSNFISLLSRAACRTPASPCDTPFPLCVGYVLG